MGGPKNEIVAQKIYESFRGGGRSFGFVIRSVKTIQRILLPASYFIPPKRALGGA